MCPAFSSVMRLVDMRSHRYFSIAKNCEFDTIPALTIPKSSLRNPCTFVEPCAHGRVNHSLIAGPCGHSDDVSMCLRKGVLNARGVVLLVRSWFSDWIQRVTGIFFTWRNHDLCMRSVFRRFSCSCETWLLTSPRRATAMIGRTARGPTLRQKSRGGRVSVFNGRKYMSPSYIFYFSNYSLFVGRICQCMNHCLDRNSVNLLMLFGTCTLLSQF